MTFRLNQEQKGILRALEEAPPSGTSKDKAGPGKLTADELVASAKDISYLRVLNLIQRWRDPAGGEDRYFITYLGQRTLAKERVS